MFSFSRLVATVALVYAVSAAVTPIVPPGQHGSWTPGNTLDPNGSMTDMDTIASTVVAVDQKAGPTADTPPDEPIGETAITAVDGTVTDAGTGSGSTRRRRSTSIQKRAISDYNQVFSGTGTGPTDRDASIQGTAYLTYTLVSNATYNIEDCLDFCSSIPQCVFANLFYEFNNPGLDAGWSNLKCSVYADVHTAAEKTNSGGQQQYPPPGGLTYIQHSGGWSAKTLVEPETPEGYEHVFGPTNGANNAPGYMGFAFLSRYDVDACAAECNNRGADPNGGACQYFNIWRAVVNGNPTTYTCSMYFIPSDASTAVNTGQGSLQVTFSRGYKRTNFVVDGGFEGFNTGCYDYCLDTEYEHWVGSSPPGGFQDATFYYNVGYAHSGHGSALLGSNQNTDKLPGTITSTHPLQTLVGRTYQISFFQASDFTSPELSAPAFVEVLWNGNVVRSITTGYEPWTLYQVTVTAIGNDEIAIRGGKAPAWSFIDDITVFLM